MFEVGQTLLRSSSRFMTRGAGKNKLQALYWFRQPFILSSGGGAT
jgi:hypothetical protein